MASLIVFLAALPGLWVTRRWLAKRFASAPIAQLAANAAKSATLTVLVLFVLLLGYAGDITPNAWDNLLGILSVVIILIGVIWIWLRFNGATNWFKGQ